MKNYLYRYIPFVILLITLFFAVKPLFVPGFFPMHDNEQVGRLYELDQTVKAGHIPPRIAPNLGFGYGYPFFNFYPSFVYYVAEIFVLFGFSYIVATKLMIAVGFLLAAVGMYLFARKYFGELGGIVAAVAYSYAPYHAVDVYVRGALPEFWGFVFFPFLFLLYATLAHANKKTTLYVCILSLLNAALILTHNLIAMMGGLFLGPFLFFLLLQTKEKKRFIQHVLLTAIFGLGLAAFFWLPSFIEKKYTMIELLTKELASYQIHFVALQQFWNSMWGYGGSIPGIHDGLSFQLGKVQILLVIVAIVFLFTSLQQKGRGIVVFFFFLFLLSLFMSTQYSQPLWDMIQPFSYIQFPWRFLLFSAFTAAFLAGSLFTLAIDQRIKVGLAIVCIIGLLVKNAGYFVPVSYLTNVTDKDYIDQNVLRWDTSKIAAEYVPKGIATRKTDIGTTVVDIKKEEIATTSNTVVSGIMQVTVVEDKPQRKEFTVLVERPGLFRLNTFAFPGWQVTVDGKETAFDDANRLKLITIQVGPGKHTIVAAFTDTPLRRMANIISLSSLLLLIVYVIYEKKSVIFGNLVSKKLSN